MAFALEFKITRAGLSAMIAANNNGLQGLISHLAIGHGVQLTSPANAGTGYEPTGLETALRNEFQRKPFGNGTRLGTNSFVLETAFDGTAQGWINEIGLIMTDGTLFAVWSDTVPLMFKASNVQTLVAVTTVFEGLPADAIDMVVAAPSLNLTFVFSLARLAAEDLRVKRRLIQSDLERYTPVVTSSW